MVKAGTPNTLAFTFKIPKIKIQLIKMTDSSDSEGDQDQFAQDQYTQDQYAFCELRPPDNTSSSKRPRINSEEISNADENSHSKNIVIDKGAFMTSFLNLYTQRQKEQSEIVKNDMLTILNQHTKKETRK